LFAVFYILLYYVDAKAIDSLDSMIDDVLCEQLMCVMNDEVWQFVVSKQAKTAADCAEFADLYTEMNVNNAEAGMTARKPPSGSGGQSAPGVAGGGGQPRNASRGGGGGGGGTGGNAQYNALRGRCYNCQETGHKWAECPYGSRGGGPGICPRCNLFHPPHIQCYARPIYAAVAEHDWRLYDDDMNACHMYGEFGRFTLPVFVNGMRVMGLRDSGCGLEAIVHPDLVNQRDYTGDFVFCRGAFDNGAVTHKVNIANVDILAPELNCLSPMTVKAGVWNLPDVQCLLGNKLFARSVFTGHCGRLRKVEQVRN